MHRSTQTTVVPRSPLRTLSPCENAWRKLSQLWQEKTRATTALQRTRALVRELAWLVEAFFGIASGADMLAVPAGSEPVTKIALVYGGAAELSREEQRPGITIRPLIADLKQDRRAACQARRLMDQHWDAASGRGERRNGCRRPLPRRSSRCHRAARQSGAPVTGRAPTRRLLPPVRRVDRTARTLGRDRLPGCPIPCPRSRCGRHCQSAKPRPRPGDSHAGLRYRADCG